MKRTLVAVVALLVVNGAFSQVKFGAKAGVNISSVSGIEVSVPGGAVEAIENDGMAFGFHGGAFANISFGKYLGLQPELLFSMQGGKQKPNSDLLLYTPELEAYSSDFRFNYIHLPILLEIKPIANAGLGILVGPQFGLNIYNSETAMGVTVSGSDFEDMLKDEFGTSPLKNFDVSLAFGLQYTFIEHLNVGLRYNLGLTNHFSVTQIVPVDYYTQVKSEAKGWKNRVFQLSAGWLF